MYMQTDHFTLSKQYGCDTLFKVLSTCNTLGTRSDASRTVTVNSWHGGDGFIRIWVPLQGVMVVVVRLSSVVRVGGDRKEGRLQSKMWWGTGGGGYDRALSESDGQLTHGIKYVFPSALYHPRPQNSINMALIPYVVDCNVSISVEFTERHCGSKNLTSKTERSMKHLSASVHLSEKILTDIRFTKITQKKQSAPQCRKRSVEQRIDEKCDFSTVVFCFSSDLWLAFCCLCTGE